MFDRRNKKRIAVNPSKQSANLASYCRTEVRVVATSPLHQELMRVKYQLILIMKIMLVMRIMVRIMITMIIVIVKIMIVMVVMRIRLVMIITI